MEEHTRTEPEWAGRKKELEKSVVVSSKLKLQDICRLLNNVTPNPVGVIGWGKNKWRIVYNSKAEAESIKTLTLNDGEVPVIPATPPTHIYHVVTQYTTFTKEEIVEAFEKRTGEKVAFANAIKVYGKQTGRWKVGINGTGDLGNFVHHGASILVTIFQEGKRKSENKHREPRSVDTKPGGNTSGRLADREDGVSDTKLGHKNPSMKVSTNTVSLLGSLDPLCDPDTQTEEEEANTSTTGPGVEHKQHATEETYKVTSWADTSDESSEEEEIDERSEEKAQEKGSEEKSESSGEEEMSVNSEEEEMSVRSGEEEKSESGEEKIQEEKTEANRKKSLQEEIYVKKKCEHCEEDIPDTNFRIIRDWKHWHTECWVCGCARRWGEAKLMEGIMICECGKRSPAITLGGNIVKVTRNRVGD